MDERIIKIDWVPINDINWIFTGGNVHDKSWAWTYSETITIRDIPKTDSWNADKWVRRNI